MAEAGGREQDFLWGVATSAYQAEGGHNVPAGSQNNWAAAEQKMSVMVTGRAADFWNRYESDFELCRVLGLNAFRLGISWSRVQPTRQVIHRIYQQDGWPAPMVSMNNYCSDLYWSDKFLIDLLTSREKGIGEAGLGDYVLAASDAFQREFANAGLPLRRDLPYWIGDGVKRLSLWLGRRMFSAAKYRPVLDALATCGHQRVSCALTPYIRHQAMNRSSGTHRTYVIRPTGVVPEPSVAVLFAAGAWQLTWRRRTRRPAG